MLTPVKADKVAVGFLCTRMIPHDAAGRDVIMQCMETNTHGNSEGRVREPPHRATVETQRIFCHVRPRWITSADASLHPFSRTLASAEELASKPS